MSAELITSTLVWFGLGWLLDRLLGTMPWFMFAGALLGNWAGLYLIWLRGQRSEAYARAQDREHASDAPDARSVAADSSRTAVAETATAGSTTPDASDMTAPERGTTPERWATPERGTKQ
jgi:hypothetical protein